MMDYIEDAPWEIRNVGRRLGLLFAEGSGDDESRGQWMIYARNRRGAEVRIAHFYCERVARSIVEAHNARINGGERQGARMLAVRSWREEGRRKMDRFKIALAVLGLIVGASVTTHGVIRVLELAEAPPAESVGRVSLADFRCSVERISLLDIPDSGELPPGVEPFGIESGGVWVRRCSR